MANLLTFDASLPETFLEVDGYRRGIKTKLEAHSISPNKAVYKPDQDVSQLSWSYILNSSQLTTLFVTLGHSISYNLRITESLDLLDSQAVSNSDPKLWDIPLLLRLIGAPANTIYIADITSLDSVFARNEIRKPVADQCQVVDTGCISYWLHSGRIRPSNSFSDWAGHQPGRNRCSWYKEYQEEKARLFAEAEARRAAEEEAKRQKQARVRLVENPRLVLRLDPTCPDWMVEIYWKALVKALHSDINNGCSPEEQKRMTALLQAVNEAHDKIKEQRGPAWSPKTLPWKGAKP